MTFECYRALRGSLHHDWLLNRFLVFVSARASQFVSDRPLSREIRARLEEWNEKRAEFLALSSGIEDALSPRQYLEEPPLNGLPPAARHEIGLLVHQRYCERSGIRGKAARLEDEIGYVDEIVTGILNQSGSADSGVKLYDKCHDLSRAIADLPIRVQIF